MGDMVYTQVGGAAGMDPMAVPLYFGRIGPLAG